MLRDDLLAEQDFTKIDQLFANSLGYLRQHNVGLAAYHFLKSSVILVFLCIYYSQHSYKSDSAFGNLLAGVVIGFIASATHAAYFRQLRNVLAALVIAEECGHLVREQINIRGQQETSSIEQITSQSVYNAQNVDVVPDEAIKKSLETNMSIMLDSLYLTLNPTIATFLRYCSIFLFLITVSIIVELIIYPQTDTLLKNVLVTYVCLEGIFQIKYFTGLLFLALSPLICLGLLFYFCCCKKAQTATAYVDRLQPLDYTATTQLQNSPECTICFQDFAIGEKILILDCPKKHAFHQVCIKHWLHVGSTCPLCRHDFSHPNPPQA